MDRHRIEYIRAALDDEHTSAVQLQNYLDELLTDAERQAAARLRAEQGDDAGHTPAARIETVIRRYQQYDTCTTSHQRQQAEQLLTDMASAAELHHVTLVDFGWVGDLPAMCVDVVLAQTRKS